MDLNEYFYAYPQETLLLLSFKIQKSHAKDLMIKEGEYRFGDFIVRANE